MNGTSRSAGIRAQRLTIVADDLTGALDTAGGFACPENPVRVFLDPPLPGSGRNALDTDSRDLAEEDAVRRVTEAFAGDFPRAGGGIVFKKVDSVMRGHPVAEAVAAFRSGGFERALFAPAFPANGRVTVEGRQQVVVASGKKAVGPQLVDALSARGISAAMLGCVGLERGFFVADAIRQSDLEAAVAAFGSVGRTLYVGTGGLAAALAGNSGTSLPLPSIELAVCGTLHPVTQRQIAAVDRSKVARFVLDGGAREIPDAPCLFVAPYTPNGRDEAALAIAQSLERIVNERGRPEAALVTGGWTLRMLCRICRTDQLHCLGLCAPGVPLCRMGGGLWNGTFIVSKSGGFGSERLLSDLFAARAAIKA